ncbi:MAG: hypothetical protein K2P68_10550 [Sphingomonas sp.]|nr:hypothetical protein [Sphingomonas sp.]
MTFGRARPAIAKMASLVALVALVTALAGCDGGKDANNLDTLDARLADGNNAANGRDPAPATALEDQIIVDPRLAQHAHKGAVLPTGRQQDRRTRNCASAVQYSIRWANRLPADLPLYPDAHVSEAAGNGAAGCNVRIVSFASKAPPQTVIDWYFGRATRAGYSAERQSDGAQRMLGGTRSTDGGAYIIYAMPRKDGGSDVDLVANNGL